MTAPGLDHVGVAVRSLDEAAAAWQAAGFQVTPTAPHLPGGVTGNRCVMLRGGYVELLGNLGGRSATLERFLARYEGIHVISLATRDAAAAARRLGRELVRSERETPQGTARFARVVLPELEPRLQLVQQITPELVWRAEEMVHPNGAAELASVVMPGGAAEAAALSRAAGTPAVPDRLGGFALADGRVRILEDVRAVFPDAEPPGGPWVAGIEVRGGAGAGRVLRAAGVWIRFLA